MRTKSSAIVVAVSLLLIMQGLPLVFAAAPNAIPSRAVAISLTIIPPKLPADSRVYPAVVVSLLDGDGLPSIALNDVNVFLTSSSANIASFPSGGSPYQLVIKAGRPYVVANITTSVTPGSTSITVSSTGLTADQKDLQTVTPSGFPSKLRVFVSPSGFLSTSVFSGTVRVELVDDAGQPSKAITPVTALLSSSNLSIASLTQPSLTIPVGGFYASGSFVTNSNSGVALFSASSTNYTSGSAFVTVVAGPSQIPSKIALKLLPGTLPTDGLTYNALEVGLIDSQNRPAVASSDTFIQLSSSQSNIVSVPNNIATILAGTTSVTAALGTSALAGLTNITATGLSTESLLPDSISVRTVIPAPSKVQVYLAPPSISVPPSGGLPMLVVQLQDSAGDPARARQNTIVVVTSDNSTIFKNSLSLVINKGSDYAFTSINPSVSGKATLTAQSQGLMSSQAQLQLAPSPLVVQVAKLSPIRSFIFTNESAFMSISVSFLGQPQQDLNVSWTASSGAMTPFLSATGSSGTTTSTFTPSGPGVYNITGTFSTPALGTIEKPFPLLVAQIPPKPALSTLQILLTYWYYIAAAIVVAAVAAFYVLRMRRKKQRAAIEAGFEVV